MIKGVLRRAVKRSYPVLCAYYAYSDWRSERKYRSGNLETHSGTLHRTLSPEESIAYVERVFADYKTYSGVGRFAGRVAEVGPGDNCGVGLLFTLDGCTSVDLVDRFYSLRDAAAQAKIYEALAKAHPGLRQRLEGIPLTDESRFPGVRRRYGAEAAAEAFFEANTGYDFIVSRAVFEHLYSPLLALSTMARALAPAGMLLHKIDLRDHAMFSEHFHELKFLEVPDWIYRRMTRASGRPNRVLAADYRKCLDATGLEYRLLVTRLAGAGDIEPHLPYEDIPQALRARSLAYVRSARGRFARSMQSLSDEDLSIAGLFVVARKKT